MRIFITYHFDEKSILVKAVVEYNSAGWDVITDKEHLARFFTSRQDAQNYADKLNSQKGLLAKIKKHIEAPQKTCMCEICISHFCD